MEEPEGVHDGVGREHDPAPGLDRPSRQVGALAGRAWPEALVEAAEIGQQRPRRALLATVIIVGGTLKRAPLDPFLIVPAALAIDAAVVCAHRAPSTNR